MATHSLLPGIIHDREDPVVVFHSREAIAAARRRAAFRDGAQLLLLIGVDVLFVHWPSTHVPFLGRHASAILLTLLNAAWIAGIWLMRRVPEWRARRIAATWAAKEQQQFRKVAKVRATTRSTP